MYDFVLFMKSCFIG